MPAPPTPSTTAAPAAPAAKRRPSIRALVALVVILPVLAASIALVTLAAMTARRIAEQMATSIVDTAAHRVAFEVRDYLNSAVRNSRLYTRRMERGVLPTSGLGAWEKLMIDDIVTSPKVASICFGNTEGESTWLLRGQTSLELGRVPGPGEGQAAEFGITDDGVVDAAPFRTAQYDARNRPWYGEALKAEPRGSGIWTPIYFWFKDQRGASTTGTGYARAIYGAPPESALRGVLVIDITLGGLSQYLHNMEIAQPAPEGMGGAVFIIDDKNQLVAASEGPVNTDSGERLPIERSSSPAARAVAHFVITTGYTSDKPFRCDIDGQPARILITRIATHPGINWRCLTILPESAFMGEAHAARRTAIMLAGAAILGSLLLGLILSRRISVPLHQLAAHVKRVGAGDFDSRLDLTQARELAEVSTELNKAAAGLKQHMELQESIHVAMEVQSSLLPDKDPEIPGMDIAGRTKYCDATGGDYYDFIDVSRVSSGTMLLALGDVMGHGVASALLMASARAALRAHVDDQGSLAMLMKKVNGVLSRDARHRRFMTLALVAVDPQHGSVRWASAGHDPAVVYFPDGDRFDELEGGDIPLGMMEDVEYQEYRRDGLVAGCILLIGTDGIWEMRNPAGEFFGKDRMLQLVRAHARKPAKEIAEALEIALSAWRADRAAQDDVTFVIAKIK